MLVLKSGKHRLLPAQISVKTVYLKMCSKVRPQLSRSSKFFDDVQYGLVDRVLWQIVSCGLQDFLQLDDGIWLGLKCLVVLKHSSSDMRAKRVEVW